MTTRIVLSDPVERTVAEGLEAANIQYVHEMELPPQGRPTLDFWLPLLNVWIECKQFHTDRITDQLRPHNNVILIQGITAAALFKDLLMRSSKISDLAAAPHSEEFKLEAEERAAGMTRRTLTANEPIKRKPGFDTGNGYFTIGDQCFVRFYNWCGEGITYVTETRTIDVLQNGEAQVTYLEDLDTLPSNTVKWRQIYHSRMYSPVGVPIKTGNS